jgi:hypothetical protein
MPDTIRTPSLHIYLHNGQLWAEGPSANGTRHKFPVNHLMEIKAELMAQGEREVQRQQRLATERHTSVFAATASVHGLPFAARTIGGKIPRKSERFFTVPIVPQAQPQGASTTAQRKRKPTAADLWIDTRISVDDLE